MSDRLNSGSLWECQPKAWAFVQKSLEDLSGRNAVIAEWKQRLLSETGTRLVDWIDHLTLGHDDVSHEQLTELGFREETTNRGVWSHAGGLFPRIRYVAESADAGVAMKVESVARFCQLHQVSDLVGSCHADFRMATVDATPAAHLWVVERHGNQTFESSEPTEIQKQALREFAEKFRDRPRDSAEGYAVARQLVTELAAEIGMDWACDRFFASERDYWQSRNKAAQIQWQRQDRLGVGWANHDHHTYRSSREHFKDLIESFESFGFHCRERFYAGAQAGWGAQVLEQPGCGLVIFADVDLSPHEVAGDFAHQGLVERQELGTVGLWCQLHGESFLAAGMHHLECQFDFDAVRKQLAEMGIETMAPFTDFAFLRQAFTQGERWMIQPDRLQKLVEMQRLQPDQAKEFERHGAIGSHLEILERNDGYKGFNQTGVSDIIHRTDPRIQHSS